MDKVCCEANEVMPMCIADYEKKTMENLNETQAILSSIYRTIVVDDSIVEDTGSVNNLMDNVVANFELTIQIRDIAKDINRVLFNS